MLSYCGWLRNPAPPWMVFPPVLEQLLESMLEVLHDRRSTAWQQSMYNMQCIYIHVYINIYVYIYTYVYIYMYVYVT